MTPEARVAVLEWCVQSAAGQADGLDWVDATIVGRSRPFALVRDTDADVRFRHAPYGAFLPPAMLQAALEAQEAGEPTALEGLLLLFARPEWLVAARRYLWTSTTPLPPILTPLVEVYGIDAELHRGQPALLATLLAHLPRWYPVRGSVPRALTLCETALDWDGATVPPTERPAGEVFACHSAGWWASRGAPPDEPLRVVNGVARMGADPPLRSPEDVALAWQPTRRFPHALLRLLPVWATLRLSTERAA